LDYVIQNGADTLVTGHYADIKKIGQRYHLCRARDESKDQSYVLWQLKQHQLSHIYFPLARYLKSEIYELAKTIGFINPHNKESQDICFIPNGDYASFIQRESGISSNPGNFIDTHGNIIGKHKGIIHYTIGQRKGLGIALGTPKHVLKIDAHTNTVILGDHDELYTCDVQASDICIRDMQWLIDSPQVTARIRYNSPTVSATLQLSPMNNSLLPIANLHFDKPVWGVTPGQSLVIYKDGLLIGGGIIQ
jgi:tRNA-specific 2-thiouridylase